MRARWRQYGAGMGVVVLLLSGGSFLRRGSRRDPVPTDGVRETRLPNGLTVLTREMHGTPVVAVNLLYRVGSGNEHPGIRGISHLLEHVTFRGTRRRGSGEIHRTLFVNGATYNGITSADYTKYFETVSADRLETVLDLEADRMVNCRVDPADVERERRIVRSEAEGREEDPRARLFRAVLSAALPHHPYGWKGGRDGDLERITREDLVHFYRAHYAPNRAVLLLAGDFSTDGALQLVRQKFGGIPAAPVADAPVTPEPPQTAERRVEIHGRGGRPLVTLAYRSPAGASPDWYGIDLLLHTLVRGPSGWMGEQLTDAHLGAEPQDNAPTRRDPYLMWFTAAAQPGVTPEQLERGMRDVLARAANGELPHAQVEIGRRTMAARDLLTQDDPQSLASTLGYWSMVQGWSYAGTYLERVRQVSESDLREIARRYFRPDHLTVGIYRPSGPGAVAARAADEEDEEPATAQSRPARPVPIPQTTPRPVRVVRTTLPNGVTLLVHENPGAPTFAVTGHLPAGEIFAPRSLPGLAGITTQMLYTTRRRSARGTMQLAQALGVQLTVNGSELTADFNLRGPGRSFSSSVYLLAEMLRAPVFTQWDADYYRPQLLAMVDRYRSLPATEADSRFRSLYFPADHPLRPVLPDEYRATVRDVTARQAEYFYRQQYGPDHFVLAVSGDVTAGEARRVVQRAFGSWRRNPNARYFPERIPPAHARPVRRFEPREGSEDYVVWGAPEGPAHGAPDDAACEVLGTILAGGGALNSRLGQKLREERALIYHLSGRFETGWFGGPFRVSFGTDPGTTDLAVRCLEAELRRVARDGVTQQEVDEAVAHLVGSLPVRLATNAGMAGELADAAFYGRDPDLLLDGSRRYSHVTRAQVNAAARAHLHPDRATLVVVGPRR